MDMRAALLTGGVILLISAGEHYHIGTAIMSLARMPLNQASALVMMAIGGWCVIEAAIRSDSGKG